MEPAPSCTLISLEDSGGDHYTKYLLYSLWFSLFCRRRRSTGFVTKRQSSLAVSSSVEAINADKHLSEVFFL
jgi:hypothetical protein